MEIGYPLTTIFLPINDFFRSMIDQTFAAGLQMIIIAEPPPPTFFTRSPT